MKSGKSIYRNRCCPCHAARRIGALARFNMLMAVLGSITDSHQFKWAKTGDCS